MTGTASSNIDRFLILRGRINIARVANRSRNVIIGKVAEAMNSAHYDEVKDWDGSEDWRVLPVEKEEYLDLCPVGMER